VKICYASDLHGHLHHYQALLALVQSEKIEAVLLGGDLLPHQERRDSGLREQIRFVQETFGPFASELRNHGIRFLGLILGNDDFAGALPEFQKLEKQGLFSLLRDSPVFLDSELAVFGYPFVPPTPFLLKDFEKRDRNTDTDFPQRRVFITEENGIREIDAKTFFETRSTIEQDLASWEMPSFPCKTICVMHSPPFGTFLDRLSNGQCAGSRAIMEFISRTQPWLTLHGHIHESPQVSGKYFQKIENTLSVNPGQRVDRFCAVVFDSTAIEKTIFHTVYD